MYLLDTNIVSYFIKGLHPALVDRVIDEMDAHRCAISSITHAELRFGLQRMNPFDKRRMALERFLPQIETLTWSAAAADIYGPLKHRLYAQGRPIGELDTQIAAHALAAGLTLVTHNTRHFEGIDGLALQDWVAAPA